MEMSVSKVSITHSCTYGKFSITWYQVKKSGVTTTIPEVDLMKSQWYNKGDLGNFLKTVSVLMVLNSLTYSQRNWDLTLLSFESALDNHLKTIPDKPQIIGYTSHRRADTNSLLYTWQILQAPLLVFILFKTITTKEVSWTTSKPGESTSNKTISKWQTFYSY